MSKDKPDTKEAEPAQGKSDAGADIEESSIYVDGLSIHVARHSIPDDRADKQSTPLLLFNGIGANAELFFPFMRSLDKVETITFDVPGVGGSDTPFFPMRFKRLAELSTRILDHFDYGVVDVLGVSWGGGLAQEFVRQFSERCRRLILVATSPGAIMVPGKPSVFLKLSSPKRYTDSFYLAEIAHHIYGGVLREDPERINEFASMIKSPQSGKGYLWQLAAATGWTSIHWLHKIQQPTLILAGTDDPLIPLVNARLMKKRIPNCRLEEIECGHLLLLTKKEQVIPMISDYLSAEN